MQRPSIVSASKHHRHGTVLRYALPNTQSSQRVLLAHSSNVTLLACHTTLVALLIAVASSTAPTTSMALPPVKMILVFVAPTRTPIRTE